MKRFRKFLLILISVVSLFSCGKETISEVNEIGNVPVEYLFIVSCNVPDQVYTVALPGMHGTLETTNTFEFHSVEKMGDFGGCYLTCKNPQATLTIQRYINGKRKKTIYGKGSITFNAKDDMY